MKHILLHISGSWLIRVRLVHPWAECATSVCLKGILWAWMHSTPYALQRPIQHSRACTEILKTPDLPYLCVLRALYESSGHRIEWMHCIEKDFNSHYLDVFSSYDDSHQRSTSHGIAMLRGGGLGSRPKKMYGEKLGDGVEHHLMKPTPRC